MTATPTTLTKNQWSSAAPVSPRLRWKQVCTHRHCLNIPFRNSPKIQRKTSAFTARPAETNSIFPTPVPPQEQERRLGRAGRLLAGTDTGPSPATSEATQGKAILPWHCHFPKEQNWHFWNKGESSGYLFLLVAHLWCVNSKSIWQHFGRQLKDGPDGSPWVSLVLHKAHRHCWNRCLLYCNLCTNRARKWGCCHLQKNTSCKEFLKIIYKGHFSFFFVLRSLWHPSPCPPLPHNTDCVLQTDSKHTLQLKVTCFFNWEIPSSYLYSPEDTQTWPDTDFVPRMLPLWVPGADPWCHSPGHAAAAVQSCSTALQR